MSDQPEYGGDIIARHLIDTYGIEPFMVSNGRLGVHFMELCSSCDEFEDLDRHLSAFIDGSRNPQTGSLAGAGAESVAEIEETLRSLQKAVAVVETALREMRGPVVAVTTS